jgi:23S rRNA (adenine2503-C2)-methyltransferase
MEILAKTGNPEIATVYIAGLGENKYVEFVESVQPPLSYQKKWVIIISTLYGCPVSCSFCDCGYYYKGVISKEDIFNQIDFLVKRKFPDSKVISEKFKIQFARIGEPSFNKNVIDVLWKLKDRYHAPGLIPSISTIAPANNDIFFENLLKVKKELYPNNFQLQFSIHSTDYRKRDEIIPVKKWDFDKIASYGNAFFDKGGRKITLNFALSNDYILDTQTLLKYFDPEVFFIKITPVNPTYRSMENGISSFVKPDTEEYKLIEDLKNSGYETLLSIGEWEENKIGSNCGQFLLTHLRKKMSNDSSYTYKPEYFNMTDLKDVV